MSKYNFKVTTVSLVVFLTYLFVISGNISIAAEIQDRSAAFNILPTWKEINIKDSTQTAPFESFTNYDDVAPFIVYIAVKGDEALFVLSEKTKGSNLYEYVQAYNQYIRENQSGANMQQPPSDDLGLRDSEIIGPGAPSQLPQFTVVVKKLSLTEIDKHLYYLIGVRGLGSVVGSVDSLKNRNIDNVTMKIVNGPNVLTFIYSGPVESHNGLPEIISTIINTLKLKGYEDPRDKIVKVGLGLIDKIDVNDSDQAMSDLAAVTSTMYRSVDIISLFKGTKLDDSLRKQYLKDFCKVYKKDDADAELNDVCAGIKKEEAPETPKIKESNTSPMPCDTPGKLIVNEAKSDKIMPAEYVTVIMTIKNITDITIGIKDETTNFKVNDMTKTAIEKIVQLPDTGPNIIKVTGKDLCNIDRTDSITVDRE